MSSDGLCRINAALLALDETVIAFHLDLTSGYVVAQTQTPHQPLPAPWELDDYSRYRLHVQDLPDPARDSGKLIVAGVRGDHSMLIVNLDCTRVLHVHATDPLPLARAWVVQLLINPHLRLVTTDPALQIGDTRRYRFASTTPNGADVAFLADLSHAPPNYPGTIINLNPTAQATGDELFYTDTRSGDLFMGASSWQIARMLDTPYEQWDELRRALQAKLEAQDALLAAHEAPAPSTAATTLIPLPDTAETPHNGQESLTGPNNTPSRLPARDPLAPDPSSQPASPTPPAIPQPDLAPAAALPTPELSPSAQTDDAEQLEHLTPPAAAAAAASVVAQAAPTPTASPTTPVRVATPTAEPVAAPVAPTTAAPDLPWKDEPSPVKVESTPPPTPPTPAAAAAPAADPDDLDTDLDEDTDLDGSETAADPAAAPEPDEDYGDPVELPHIWVNFLGPVTVTPPDGENLAVRTKSNTINSRTEILARLALAGTDGITTAEFDQIAWPDTDDAIGNAKRNQYVSRLRKEIGPGPDPDTPTIERIEDRYRFNPAVISAWDVLRDLVPTTPAAVTTATLEAAATLIQGKPFQDIPEVQAQARYRWTKHVVDEATDTCTDILLELGTRLETRNPDRAHAAAVQGVKVDNRRQDLWRLAIATADDNNAASLIRRMKSVIPVRELESATKTLIKKRTAS